MTPADRLLQKTLVASRIDSKRWEAVRAGLRDRAFFSSRVESLRLLREARARTAALLSSGRRADGALESRASAVRAIREAAEAAGAATGEGGLKDPGSARRAALIVDTNARLAAEHVRWEGDMDYASRLAFPCREFVRAGHSRKPRRDWPERWKAAGGKTYAGRMVAPVDDPVWERLSRFGLPYPPFDYGSRMGVRAVSRADAVEIGAIPPDYSPPEETPPERDFNARLDAGLGFKPSEEERKFLDDAFGDQLKYSGGRLAWRGSLIRDAVKSGQGKYRLGEPTRALLDALPPSVPADKITRLSLPGQWLHTHAAKHLGVKSGDGANLTLLESDFDLIPSIWRAPDRVTADAAHPESILLRLDAMDGGEYVLGVNYRDGCRPTTFHKRKKK